MPHPVAPRAVAVVVAYNRCELLAEVLDALAEQSTPPAAVVVVDNASSDGSGEAASAHALGVDLVTLGRNTGGAGGFAAGMARAMAAHAPDWVWLMDDDTVPTPSALAELLRAVDGGAAGEGPREKDRAASEVVLAGSRVVWTDGRDHPMNTPRRKPFVGRRERRDAEARDAVAVRSSSFVSMLVKAEAVRERGLPIGDYFIWNDDFEYSTRLLRGRHGLFVPSSVVVHKTKQPGNTDADPGERFYFEVRNKLWLLRHSRGLNPAEKALYGGSTAVRWGRTMLRSGDRATLRRGLARGWRDGVGAAPRGNADVLDGLGAIVDEVRAAEAATPGRVVDPDAEAGGPR